MTRFFGAAVTVITLIPEGLFWMPASFMLAAAVLAAVCYMLGSVNLAVILSRKIKGQDVREHGSGNAGTTNMLRTFGWTSAALTFGGDIIKGAISVVLCRAVFVYLGYEAYAAYGGYLGGIASLLGQMYPVYFGFKGGKGVASAIGAMGAINPLLCLAVFSVGLLLAVVTGYVSMGSVLCAVAYPFLVLALMTIGGGTFDLTELILVFSLAGMLLLSHKDNIKRLLNGTENKFTPRRNKEQ